MTQVHEGLGAVGEGPPEIMEIGTVPPGSKLP